MMMDDFKNFLHMANKTPSTISRYAKEIEMVKSLEGYDDKASIQNIARLVIDYSSTGIYRDINQQSHGYTSAALKWFWRYLAFNNLCVSSPSTGATNNGVSSRYMANWEPLHDGKCSYNLKFDIEVANVVTPQIVRDLEYEYSMIIDFAKVFLTSTSPWRDKDALGTINIDESFNSSIINIPILFSPEIKTKKYEYTKKEIADRIVDLKKRMGADFNSKQVLDILNHTHFTDTIMGEFIKSPEPYIVIYYKVIPKNNYQEFLANLATTLAHEYMHFLEHAYCLQNNKKSYQNKKVSEALADFFSIAYILSSYQDSGISERKQVAQERYNCWVDRFGSRWPYANALYFYTIKGKTQPLHDYFPNYGLYRSRIKLIFSQTLNAKNAYKTLTKF